LDILAVYGAGSALTTIAFLVFCFRAVEAPYNDWGSLRIPQRRVHAACRGVEH